MCKACSDSGLGIKTTLSIDTVRRQEQQQPQLHPQPHNEDEEWDNQLQGMQMIMRGGNEDKRIMMINTGTVDSGQSSNCRVKAKTNVVEEK